MKWQIIIITLVTLIAACSDEVENTMQAAQKNEINAFVIPDSMDIKKELVIAAYYEIHPKKACVILAYNDTTRTSAKKFAYSGDSSFVIQELLCIGYNDFKTKSEPVESYIVKPASVVKIRIDGISSFDTEHERIDVAK